MHALKYVLLLLFMGLVQVSCTAPDKRSVLVIAIDQLSSTDVTCNQDENRTSGFQILCNESVRFTHAFSPSPLSVPSLTSILTGLTPTSHGIHHNGGPGLSAEIETVQEAALRKEFRTSFFSGGAPVFRKSALNQGFEVFEDNINPTLTSLHRPLFKNIENFEFWLKQEAGQESFFSVLYVPDLLHINSETNTNLGDVRNLTYESQLDEIDESLYDLFSFLKSTNRWDRTTVILVGLNGHNANERPHEISPMNLHVENTQVALLIKPSQKKKRDEALHWKVDQNVSLIDIGKTLFDLVGHSIVEDDDSDFPAISLINSIKNSNAEFDENRLLYMESGWAQWRFAGPLRTALIANHVLYIHDTKPLLYNTLVDRLEVNPLPLLQESILPTTKLMNDALEKNQIREFKYENTDWTLILSLPFSRWMRLDQEALLLAELKNLLYFSPQNLHLIDWVAQISVARKDWETLKAMALKKKNLLWQFVADANLNTKGAKLTDPCLDLLRKTPLESEDLKACSDPLFLELVDWIRADERGLSREYQKNKFSRSYRYHLIDQKIQRTNVAAGIIWDTSIDNIFAPSKTELALNLPEYTKLRNQLVRSIQIEE